MPTPAIDVHGHYGIYTQVGLPQVANAFMTADAAGVVARAREADTELTVVSPLLGLMPRGKASAAAGNEEAWGVVAETEGLLQWVIVNPLEPKTYDQARRMLHRGKCVGIKLHPEEHLYNIADHGRELFAFAAEHEAVVLVHSGEQRSMPQDYVRFANDFPAVKLILAHIGCGWDNDPTHQVRGIQMSRHGNVFADTSSARSILPHLIEWAVAEVGVERVLYGTDTPLYFSAMQRARIDHAELTEAQKRAILRDNAAKLLRLETRQPEAVAAHSEA